MLASIAERERFRAKLNNLRRDIRKDGLGVSRSLPSPFGEGSGVRPSVTVSRTVINSVPASTDGAIVKPGNVAYVCE